MPMIDVTYPEGALTEDERSTLAEELTTVLLRAERAPDTEFFRNVTWIYLHELPENTVLAAGRPVSEPTFRLEVTTPEGALSDRRRAELVAEATRAVREVTGIAEDDSLRIWVLCREIDEGSWGAGGHVVQFQQLREAAKQQREQSKAAAAP
ncbi:MAG: tautomerase family protein [Actinomycetota bacterium]|nr:tautomerase family protein [Actinomycetota bacterium]